MDILKRKTRREPGLPDYLSGQSTVWSNLHIATCDVMSGLTGGNWKPVERDIEQGDIKSLIQALPPTGLFFGFSNALDTFPVFMYFDGLLSACATSTSLASPCELDEDSYEPELLDVLLFKPLVEIAMEELNKLLISTISTRMEIRQVWEGVSSRDIQLPRGTSVWNDVKFSMKLTLPEDAQTQLEADLQALCEKPLTFSIFMPQSVTQQLMSQAVSEEEEVMHGDIDSPWAEHMSRAVETAAVPVRAVIESCRMTVADCTRLQIGDVIDLPGVSLQSIAIETEMLEGPEKIGSAALGIYKSHRALKLTEDLALSHSPKSEIVDL